MLPPVLLVVLVAGCRAPEASAVAPVDPRFAELCAWTEARMAEWSVPGVAIAVVEDGEVRHVAGLGVRQWGRPEPVTPDTLFRIGSVSKMFTGMLVAEEVVAGRLDLGAPASDALGGVSLAEPGALDGLTLLQLSSHTSGIQSTDFPRTCDTDRDALEPALAEMATDWALWTPPDELYHYANQGYALLGLAAQRSAGAPFADLAQRLLDAAGMTTATYDWGEAFRGEFATGHTMNLATGEPLAYRSMSERACVASYPSGGLMASASDMAGALRVLVHGGEGWVTPEAWALLTTEGYARTETSGYGFGLQGASYRGYPGLTHHGSVGGYFAMQWTVPSEGLGVMVLVNADHTVVEPPIPWSKPTQRIMERALDTFLGLEPEERESSVRPVEDWGRYVGLYHSDFDLGDVTIALDGDTLLYADADGVVPLAPYSRDSFNYAVPRDDGRTSYVGVSFAEGTADTITWLVTDTGIARRR